MTAESDVIERLTDWAGAQPDIRALLLTSSRGNGAARPVGGEPRLSLGGARV